MKCSNHSTRARWALLAAAGASALLCGAAMAQTPAQVIARAQTQNAAEIQNAAIALDERTPANSRIIVAAGLDGLQIYSLDGRRRSALAAGEVSGLGLAYDFTLNGAATTLLATTDGANNTLRFFALTQGALREVGGEPIALDFAAENVCFYRHAADRQHYIFILGDDGEVDQRLVYAADGVVRTRAVRRLNVPSTLSQCAADSARGLLYASEETVGVWRFNADPEADVDATLIDSARFGELGGEIGGIALYDGGEGAQWLIVSGEESGRLLIYDRARDDAIVGAFTVAPRNGEAIEEPGRVFTTSMALGRAYPNGLLTLVDEAGPNVKLISFADIAAATGVNAGAPQNPRTPPPAPPFATVMASVDTTPVGSFGDAADDPAIWVNRANPAQSLVLGTDKRAGLYVYDMAGEVVQFLPDGKMNNVDLRDNFALGGERVTLVTASNRTDRSIAIYRLDPGTRQLSNVADGVQPTGLNDPYGLCMYQNPQDGRTYVFINGDDTRKRQWELVDAGNGRVRAVLVRDLTFNSQTEGCVADDETGMLYVGEEDVATWRLSAAPQAAQEMVAVERIADNPALRDDIEGMGLYDLGGGRGYLIISSQGNNSYAVYRREGAQEYLGSFVIVANPAANVDGASETDGLDVTSANLGPGFEHGMLVVQDGRNVMPEARQNYKYVPWTAIAAALDLEVRR